ncbi:hypothetical protein NQZ68_038063 [Dissostichus eleginoides]|nr:hypothetical protein NQZ68_038063 [Dissostichus eleginoides]
MLSQQSARTWSRQLSCVIHCIERGCLALSEHVLRGDGQDLASSCSYRSLLALLLLPYFPLITTDNGSTGLCLHTLIERVLSCLGKSTETGKSSNNGHRERVLSLSVHGTGLMFYKDCCCCMEGAVEPQSEEKENSKGRHANKEGKAGRVCAEKQCPRSE